MGNRLSWIPRLVLLSLVVLVAAKGRQASDESSARGGVSKQADWAIRDSDQASAKAREILGMTDQDLPTESQLVELEDDNTPFLSDQIIGRPIWHVEIRNWVLELPSAPPNLPDQYLTTLDVYLDPVDARLLKVLSRWPDGVRPMPPEPDAKTTTDQVFRSGSEVYHAFVLGDPLITLLEALEIISQDSVVPFIAKQIQAQYVMGSRLGQDPRPVWAITFRGVPSLSPHPFSDDWDYQWRVIIDAETRKWVFATNTPHPVWSERTASGGGAEGVTLDLFSPADQQPVDVGQIIQWDISASVSTGDNLGLALISIDLVQDSENAGFFNLPPGDGPPAGMEGFDRPAGISNPGPNGQGSAYGGTPLVGVHGGKDLVQIGGAQNTLGVSGGSVGQELIRELIRAN